MPSTVQECGKLELSTAKTIQRNNYFPRKLQYTPRAHARQSPFANYERNPFVACWCRLFGHNLFTFIAHLKRHVCHPPKPFDIRLSVMWLWTKLCIIHILYIYIKKKYVGGDGYHNTYVVYLNDFISMIRPARFWCFQPQGSTRSNLYPPKALQSSSWVSWWLSVWHVSALLPSWSENHIGLRWERRYKRGPHIKLKR